MMAGDFYRAARVWSLPLRAHLISDEKRRDCRASYLDLKPIISAEKSVENLLFGQIRCI
jgi:hypothetical protein